MWCGRVVDDTLRGGVGAVVEEHTTAGEAMGGPVVDTAFVVCIGTDDIRAFGPVVKGLSRYVGEVPETIPLCAALGLERVREIGLGQNSCWPLR